MRKIKIVIKRFRLKRKIEKRIFYNNINIEYKKKAYKYKNNINYNFIEIYIIY